MANHLPVRVVNDKNARVVREFIGTGEVGPAAVGYLGVQDSGVLRYAVGGDVKSPAIGEVVGVGEVGRGGCGRACGQSGRGLIQIRPCIGCSCSWADEVKRAREIFLKVYWVEVVSLLDPAGMPGGACS